MIGYFKFQNKFAGKEIKFLNQAGGVFTEAIGNIKTVLAFAGEQTEIDKSFNKIFDSF